MTGENKEVKVEEEKLEVHLVAKASPELRMVTFKASASIDEDEVLAKHTIGGLEKEEDDAK